jgi:hypothetical protein
LAPLISYIKEMKIINATSCIKFFLWNLTTTNEIVRIIRN